MTKGWKVTLAVIVITIVLSAAFWQMIMVSPCGNFDKGSNEAACIANCKEAKCNYFTQNNEDFCNKLCKKNYYHSTNADTVS